MVDIETTVKYTQYLTLKKVTATYFTFTKLQNEQK